MKAGYLQFCPEFNNLEKTLRSLDLLITKELDVDLLVLPELCNSGYNFANTKEAHLCAEEAENSRFISFLQGKCRELDCSIVSGFNELDKSKLYNSSVLVSQNGLQGVYRKLHLFNTEKQFFQPGNLGLPVFQINEAKIGMLICFDWIFPEAWCSLAVKGVDLICHPANLVLPGFAQQAVPVHSLTNRIYVITANRTGSEKELTFTGRSIIADPKGCTISEAPETKEHLFVADLDLQIARNKQITPGNNLITDRRPEEYR